MKQVKLIGVKMKIIKFTIILIIIFNMIGCTCGIREIHKYPPPGYIIITNGYEFTWKKSNHTSLYYHKTKQEAIDLAWEYYDYCKKEKQRENSELIEMEGNYEK